MYLKHNSLNIYWNRECFEQTRKENESYILCMPYGFWDNRTNKMLCIHFQIFIFNNHHGLLITHKTSIMCFSVIHGLTLSTSMDNWECTVPAAAGLYEACPKSIWFYFFPEKPVMTGWQIWSKWWGDLHAHTWFVATSPGVSFSPKQLVSEVL
jgi:hypothetical protein